MISQVMATLNARRNSLQDKDKGFTLIELLVVIVIIGILAAIAIPVYLGVQNNAKDAGVKSDLTNAKTAVIAYETDKTVLPGVGADITAISVAGLGTYGFTQVNPPTTALGYSGTPSSTAFCLHAHSVTGKDFYVTDSTGVVEAAAAPAGC